MSSIQDMSFYTRLETDIKPLWGININDNYYEYEFTFKNDVNPEKELGAILNMNTVKCCICNIEVPYMYLEEHNNSSLHTKLLEITSEVLDRSREHIVTKVNQTNAVFDIKSTYFCETCCVIVEEKDKIKHNTSETHKKYKNFGDIINFFHDAFVNNDTREWNDFVSNLRVSKIEKEHIITGDLNVPKTTQNDKITVKSVASIDELLNETIEHLRETSINPKNTKTEPKITDSTMLTITTKDRSDTTDLNQRHSETQNHTNDTRELEILNPSDIKKHLSNTENSKNKQLVKPAENAMEVPKIETKSDPIDLAILEKLRIESEKNDRCYLNLLLCNSLNVIELAGDRVEITTGTLDKISIPVSHYHGIQYCLEKVFCRLCHSFLDDLSEHIHSPQHVKNITSFIVDKHCLRPYGEIPHHCGICNTSFLSALHIESESHKLNLNKYFVKAACEETTFTLEKQEHTTETINTKETKKIVTPKRNSVNDLFPTFSQVSSDIEPERKTTKYCFLCHIDIEDFESHKKSDIHKKVCKENKQRSKELKKLIRIHNLASLSDKLECVICRTPIEHEKNSVENHVKSEGHIKKYFSFIGNNKIIVIDDDECFCELCNKKILRANFIEHCSSLEHLTMIHAKKQTKPLTEPEKKTVPELNIEKNKKILQQPSSILYQFKPTDSNELICKICNTSVPQNIITAAEHTKTPTHLQLYDTTMICNQITKNNAHYDYCGVCSVNIGRYEEISHIHTNTHLDNLLKNANKKPNENKIPPKENPPKNMVPLKIMYQCKKESEHDYKCKICAKIIPKINLVDHFNSKAHKTNFDKTMTTHQIKRRNEVYYCVYCNVTITRFNEIDHLFGKQHTKNMLENNDVIPNLNDNLNYDYITSIRSEKLVKL